MLTTTRARVCIEGREPWSRSSSAPASAAETPRSLALLLAVALLLALLPTAAANGGSDDNVPTSGTKPRIVLFGDSITEFAANEGGWAGILAAAYSRRVSDRLFCFLRCFAASQTAAALRCAAAAAVPAAPLPPPPERLSRHTADADTHLPPHRHSIHTNETKKADVLVRGFGGYNSRYALWAADEAAKAGQGAGGGGFKLATIGFGANDAVSPSSPDDGFLAVPLAEFSSNIKSLVQRFRSAGAEGVVVITPPPLDDSKWSSGGGKRSNARVAQYAAAAAAAAREAGAAVVDLHSLIQRQDPSGWRSSMLAADGLHLSAQGNRALADAVLSAVASSYPNLKPYSLPQHMPVWKAVDAKNPSSTFARLG